MTPIKDFYLESMLPLGGWLWPESLMYLPRNVRRRLKKIAADDPMILSILDTRFKGPLIDELPDARILSIARNRQGKLLPIVTIYGKPSA